MNRRAAIRVAALVLTTAYTRDSQGRPVAETRSDGSILIRTYDQVGNLLSERTGAGSFTTYTWDGAGKLIRARRPTGSVETRGYDPDGRLLRESRTASAGSWTTTYAYDLAQGGRLTKVTHPDGTAEEMVEFDPDDAVRRLRDRHGNVQEFVRDAANRITETRLTPGSGSSAVTSDTRTTYDALSRVLSTETVGQPDSKIQIEYDLGGRPKLVTHATGVVESRAYDLFDNPIDTGLAGFRVGDPAFGSLVGLSRSYADPLDRLTATAVTQGAASLSTTSVSWFGAGMKSLTTPSLNQQLTYKRPGLLEEIAYGLGTTGQRNALGFTYRDADNYRDARSATGSVLSNQSFGYVPDEALRLVGAASGKLETFSYAFGLGDELQRQTRAKAARTVPYTAGHDGRIDGRDGIPYEHDARGNRTRDERNTFVYSHRDELLSVKPTTGPYAGHLVTYRYDALGNLIEREHKGKVPEGGGESDRPFLEKRLFHYADGALFTETGTDQTGSAARWRRAFVNGPAGLDDAVRYRVLDYRGGNNVQTNRAYTLVRDEQGSVLSLVREPEPGAPATGPPAVLAKIFYTPFGEAHVEAGPEIVEGKFDSTITTLDGVTQASVPGETVSGALTFRLTTPIDPQTLTAQSLAIDVFEGGEWRQADRSGWVVARHEDDQERLSILPRTGWRKSDKLWIRLTRELKDEYGRRLRPPSVEGDAEAPQRYEVVLDVPSDGATAPVYERTFGIEYETATAAGETLDGEIPSGLAILHQGSWADPVTGLYFKRARWYDPRSGTFLSEDPLGNIDSPSKYAYVGWRPNEATDPTGTIAIADNLLGGVAAIAIGKGMACLLDDCKYSWADAGVDFGLGFATSGLSSLKALKYIGRGTQLAGTATSFFAGEYVRREARGQHLGVDYSLGGLAGGAVLNTVIGEAGSYVGRQLGRGIGYLRQNYRFQYDPGVMGAFGGGFRIVARGAESEFATIGIRYVEGMPLNEFRMKATALQELGEQGLLYRAQNAVVRDRRITQAYRQGMIDRIWRQYGEVNEEFADRLIDRVTRRMSPDHVWELQLGGPDSLTNLKFLDRFTNENIGRMQIWPQIKNLPVGTRIKIRIEGLPR